MAAVVLGPAAAASTTNSANVSSASFTPAANDLLVAIAFFTGNTAAITISDSQGGATWVEITSALKNASADRIRVFVRSAKVAASAMTVTSTRTGTTTGGGLVVLRVSGMSRNGAAAVRQSARQENQAGGATPAPSFLAACLTANPTIVAVFNGTNPAGITPNASWSERADTGYGTPNTGIEVATRDSGFTGTTITGSNTSASAWCSIALELDTSAVPVTGTGAVTDAVDVVAGEGSSVAPATTGSGAVTDAVDTVAGAGKVVVKGAAASTDAVDTVAAAGAAVVKGAAAVSDDVDVAAAVGVLPTRGAAAATDGGDVASAAGTAVVAGAGSPTDAADVVAGVGANVTRGTASVADGVDAVAAAGLRPTRGSAAVDDVVDEVEAFETGLPPVVGAGAVTDASDFVLGVGRVPVSYTFPSGLTFSIMPGLSVARLTDELRRTMDPTYEDFAGFPEDDAAAALAWANALDAFTLGGAGVLPPSSTGAAAKAALVVGLAGMSAPGGFLALADAAFAAYATALAGGMPPATVNVPPPLPLTIPLIATTFPAGMAGASAAVQCAAIAAVIDAWLRTGTSTPVSGGSPAPWT